MVASATKAVPPVVSSIQDIPLGKIRESKTNPRRVFDDTKLVELAENIRQHGVLQPILERPLPKGEAGTYELVAGARRGSVPRPSSLMVVSFHASLTHSINRCLVLQRELCSRIGL